MKKNIVLIEVIIALLFLFRIAHAEPYSEVANPISEAGRMWFDSLDVRFVGNWPFGPSETVTMDESRNFVFLGAGGAVYVLDVSNPANPIEVTEAIQTRGFVNDLFYDSNSQLLFIANVTAGLRIWSFGSSYGVKSKHCTLWLI